MVFRFRVLVMEPSWPGHGGFLFSAIRKSKTLSNISLLLKPRKDSQGFIQGAGFAFTHHAGRICLHAKAKHALDRRDVNGEAARLHALVNGEVTRLDE